MIGAGNASALPRRVVARTKPGQDDNRNGVVAIGLASLFGLDRVGRGRLGNSLPLSHD